MRSASWTTAASFTVAGWLSSPRTIAYKTASSASASTRINERARRRSSAAAAKARNPASVDAARRCAGRRAVHRLVLHLRDADRRWPRDGDDDLHHGLGPHG